MVPEGVAIFLATSPVDLRGGFDRLSGIVVESLRSNPRSGSLYLFTNRRRTHLKALFFDQTGFCILYKRLDRGTFPMPMVIAPGALQTEISNAELALLLKGVIPLPGRKSALSNDNIGSFQSPTRPRKKDIPITH